MKLQFLVLFCSLFFFWSCTKSKITQKEHTTSYQKGKGNRFYGGIFRTNETEYVDGFFPHYIIDPISQRVSNHIFEGLVKYNPQTFAIEPSLANYYKVDSSQNRYTFYLKHDVFFHDNDCFPNRKGRELVADDVAFCLRLLQKQSKINRGYNMAKNVFPSSNDSLLNIRVLDDYTIQFQTKDRNAPLLDLLASSFGYIFPREAYEMYGNAITLHPVGTGPFYVKQVTDITENLSIFLSRNPIYHQQDEHGNSLPFLDGIEFSFLKEQELIVNNFFNYELDFVAKIQKKDIDIIQNDSLKKSIYHNYKIKHISEQTTHYLGFNHAKNFLGDTVRKAFEYAINTKELMGKVLPYNPFQKRTITPPYFTNYPIDSLNLPVFNVDSAQKLLAKAGYPNGENFPKISISLYTDGERNSLIANTIKRQLKTNLNITVEINPMSLVQHLETILNGETDLFLADWTYQSAKVEDFLYSFYGQKGYPNMTNYRNANFDVLFSYAVQTKNPERRNIAFAKAEQNVLNNIGIIPLWHDQNFYLLQPKIRNFYMNAQQIYNLNSVYFEPPQTLKEVF